MQTKVLTIRIFCYRLYIRHLWTRVIAVGLTAPPHLSPTRTIFRIITLSVKLVAFSIADWCSDFGIRSTRTRFHRVVKKPELETQFRREILFQNSCIASPENLYRQRHQSCGVGGRDPPDFGLEGCGVSQDGSWGARGLVVKYYYILSCTGSMFESGDFWREIE